MTSEIRKIEKAEYIQTGRYLYKVLNSALTGKELPEIPEGVNWHQVYSLAKQNSLSAAAYYGMKLAPEKPDELLQTAWKREVLFHTSRQIQMDQVREQLSKRMDQNGVDYIYLKGIIFQDYYPIPGMRQMSDNDILYRLAGETDTGLSSRSQKKMKEIMDSLGAKTVSDDGCVDVFLVEPYSLFEMHREFLGPDQKNYAYYHQLFNRAVILDPSRPHHYSLTLEEHYVLMLVHSHKHFTAGGCGPRELLDVRQYLSVNAESMDWNLVQEILEETGLSEYERQMRHLVQVIFEECAGTSEDWKILDWMMGCGTYGNNENAVRNSVSKLKEDGSAGSAKFRYIWNRLFPSPEYLQTHFPFFYRHRSLIGFLLIYRTGRGLYSSRKRLWQEWQNLKKV